MEKNEETDLTWLIQDIEKTENHIKICTHLIEKNKIILEALKTRLDEAKKLKGDLEKIARGT